MRHRIYTVKMPSDGVTPVNILVEGPFGADVGAPSKPVAAGVDGFYAEWRNRPLRIPQKALLPNLSPNPAFAPFLRLGFALSAMPVIPITPAVPIPAILLSRSLVGPVLVSAAGATTNGDGGFVDFGAQQQQPRIALVNAPGAAGFIYRVYFDICQARDDDRDDTGSV